MVDSDETKNRSYLEDVSDADVQQIARIKTLWSTVLLFSINDAFRNNTRRDGGGPRRIEMYYASRARDAVNFLNNSRDFRIVCSLADIDPDWLFMKIRNKYGGEALAPPPYRGKINKKRSGK